eukprot:scaffold7000_cov156-Skeletonema_dohrnii-CCMP3373.AAC.22
MVIDAKHTTSHHSPSGATTWPFTSVSSRHYIHNTVIMTGNHRWKGGMAGVRVWKAGTSSLPSGEDINVDDTNEGASSLHTGAERRRVR